MPSDSNNARVPSSADQVQTSPSVVRTFVDFARQYGGRAAEPKPEPELSLAPCLSRGCAHAVRRAWRIYCACCASEATAAACPGAVL